MASVFDSTNSAMVMFWYRLLNIASCPNSSLEKLFGLIPTLMLVQSGDATIHLQGKSIFYFLPPILHSLLKMFNKQICRVQIKWYDIFE